MNNAAVFICEPLTFNKNIKIYPPKIRDVVSNDSFSQYLKLFSLTQDEIKDELGKKVQPGEKLPTPFEFLLINSHSSPVFYEVVKEAFHFFIHQEITILFDQKLIVVGELKKVLQNFNTLEDLVTINEQNYFDFQNVVREACGMKPITPPGPPDPNEDPRIAAIKEKARMRERIKSKQAEKKGISLSTSLTAICCMGIGLTPLNIGEMSYAAIHPLTQMYQEKCKYETDVECLIAGADSKKLQPKYWIRNLDDENK